MNIYKFTCSILLVTCLTLVSGCLAKHQIYIYNECQKDIELWQGSEKKIVIKSNAIKNNPSHSISKYFLGVGKNIYSLSDRNLNGFESKEITDLADEINEPSAFLISIHPDGTISLGLRVSRTGDIKTPLFQPSGYPLKLNGI